jgi:hypothetical protein
MSGIIAVYGLVVSVLLSSAGMFFVPFSPLAPFLPFHFPSSASPHLISRFPYPLSVRLHIEFEHSADGPIVKKDQYTLFASFIHLAAGLSCGMTGISAGYAIGIVGDSVSAQFLHFFILSFFLPSAAAAR